VSEAGGGWVSLCGEARLLGDDVCRVNVCSGEMLCASAWFSTDKAALKIMVAARRLKR
jgi:hypothetical protein